jgi:hypothetical protein
MTKDILKITDDKQRRIIISKKIWDAEGLEKGDSIEVDIKKIKL